MRENGTRYLVTPEARGPRDRASAPFGDGVGASSTSTQAGDCADASADGSMPIPSFAGAPERHADVRYLLELAQELWWLAGDTLRAEAIAELVEHAAVELGSEHRPMRVLHRREIGGLLALLEDLDEALKQTIVDDELSIRPERMAEVRRRAELIDVDERRGAAASAAVWEALARVWALRNLLEETRERGLDVAMDA